MVFQSYALYPTKTVRDNITFGMRARGAPHAEQDAAVADVSSLLHIGGLLDRKPSQLSGGSASGSPWPGTRAKAGRFPLRRAALQSRCQAQDRMRTEIKKLHQRLGKTTVYVTHDQIEAMTARFADRRHGQWTDSAIRYAHAIYEEPADLFVAGFIGSPPMNMVKGRLRRNGVLTVEVGELRGEGIAFPLHAELERRIPNLTAMRWYSDCGRDHFRQGAELPGPGRFNFEASSTSWSPRALTPCSCSASPDRR